MGIEGHGTHRWRARVHASRVSGSTPHDDEKTTRPPESTSSAASAAMRKSVAGLPGHAMCRSTCGVQQTCALMPMLTLVLVLVLMLVLMLVLTLVLVLVLMLMLVLVLWMARSQQVTDWLTG